MSADFLIPKGPLPHIKNFFKRGRQFLFVPITISLLLIVFALRFYLPPLPLWKKHISPCYQSISHFIQSDYILAWLSSLLNPEFKKREETIRQILAVLERYETGLEKIVVKDLARVIYDEATLYKHDPKFILALIAIESSFHNWSVSEKGAKGLMQLMPYVAESIAQELGIEWKGDRTLFNPFLNIKMGVYYFSGLLRDFKEPVLALTAYNYGPTYVRSLIGRNKKVPQNYYRRIQATYHNLLNSTEQEVTLPFHGQDFFELPT